MANAGARPIVTHDRKVRYAATYPENEALFSFLRKELPEEVLDPELPIVDCHHHFWDFRGRDAMSQFRQRVYKLPEILEDMYDGHNVVKIVFTQANAFYHARGVTGMPDLMRPLGEVEYCQGVAALCDSGVYGNCRVCAGIVGGADFQDPEVEKLLQAQMRYRNFRGIRTTSWGKSLPNMLENEGFVRGMGLLEKYNLVFEWVGFFTKPGGFNEDSFPTLKKVAQRFPKVTIVMNHLGAFVRPEWPKETVDKWKAGIQDVGANCPNVVAKLGGSQQDSNGYGFEKRDVPIGSKELSEIMLPWYSTVIDAFGPQRCMFESNFPPDKECVSFRTLFNAFKRICAAKGLSAAEKRAIFHDTAVRAYRLDDTFNAKL